MTAHRPTGLDPQEVEETQVKPVAGVWVCPHCGRRIQVITESEHEKVQPFICVCGTEMVPGEEHSPVMEANRHGGVVDD
jgi:hypothetical protein